MPAPTTNRPRISCSTGSLYHLPLATALAVIRDAGYDGVEMVASPETIMRGLPAVQRIVARAGLPALSFHPPLYPFPGWPRTQLGGMLSVVAGAQALDCAVGVIHAPKGFSLATPRARQYVAGIDIARQLAAQHGIAIGFETTQRPHDGRRAMLFDDLDVFLTFADEHDLGVTLDTSHAGANGDSLLAVLAQIGPRLRNVHLSDCRVDAAQRQPSTHRMPGDGNTVDLAAFIRALGQADYDGLITLEVAPPLLGLWPPAQIARRLAEARAFVTTALDAGMAANKPVAPAREP